MSPSGILQFQCVGSRLSDYLPGNGILVACWRYSGRNSRSNHGKRTGNSPEMNERNLRSWWCAPEKVWRLDQGAEQLYGYSESDTLGPIPTNWLNTSPATLCALDHCHLAPSKTPWECELRQEDERRPRGDCRRRGTSSRRGRWSGLIVEIAAILRAQESRTAVGHCC